MRPPSIWVAVPYSKCIENHSSAATPASSARQSFITPACATSTASSASPSRKSRTRARRSATASPPGGETVADLRLRVRDFLDGLAEDAVLVAHAGVMKLCVAELAGVAPDAWFSMRFDYGSASLIEDGSLVWQNRPHG